MKKPALDGIRVLSLGTGGVVPDCVKTLGEMGADVIKIESKQNLDFVRTIGWDINAVPGFNEINRNARSFGVNLKTAAGGDLVKTLVKRSDIVTENFRAGASALATIDPLPLTKIDPGVNLDCGAES